MKNHILLGLMALGALVYSALFLLLPQTAMNLSNASWGFFLNLFGFLCFIGGWAIFLHLWSESKRRIFVFAMIALLCEIAALAGSPAVQEFVQTHLNQYLAICSAFFGPVAGSLYILSLMLRLHRKGASA